jgi:diacylglycerol kinase family enzyme
MFPVTRALLIINRTAGVGNDVVAERLTSMFEESLNARSEVSVEVVSDHRSARNCTAGFLRSSDAPSFIVAGGGGGTLRAVIEGICGEHASGPLPGPERVRVGALRMGSGNVLAKRFGAPGDPIAALQGLLKNLATGRTVPCCVMRCEVWNRDGHSEIHHAATIAGLGQFGCVPSDLARWQTRLPGLHQSAARLLGIETLTNLEYATALFVRSVSGVLFSKSSEAIAIRCNGQEDHMRLLSGIAMSFPIAALPFKPRQQNGQSSISVFLIPLGGRLSPLVQMFPQSLPNRARCITLEADQHLEIRLTDREALSFFLDEDTVTTFGRLRLGVAGSMAFVPGPNYLDGESRQ